jgi:hypothetical protein
MLAMVAEFTCRAVLGLALGFAAHWWKSHADPHPDVLDEDRPLMNMALTEYSAENYLLGHRYDEGGYWEYLSLTNLKYYLGGGLSAVLGAVYATAAGHPRRARGPVRRRRVGPPHSGVLPVARMSEAKSGIVQLVTSVTVSGELLVAKRRASRAGRYPLFAVSTISFTRCLNQDVAASCVYLACQAMLSSNFGTSTGTRLVESLSCLANVRAASSGNTASASAVLR